MTISFEWTLEKLWDSAIIDFQMGFGTLPKTWGDKIIKLHIFIMNIYLNIDIYIYINIGINILLYDFKLRT